MGSSDEGTPAKPSKPTSAQEAPPAIPSYPEWASQMQAYYGAGATPPFFASAVASPTPHPYMWGSQHPLMPPYGTPIPYPALYHPGGVYAHPNMAMAPSTSQANVESDAKASEGKGHTSVKKSKGSSSGKKTASSSGNDGATQSSESGSDGSSDANDENNDQEFPASKKGSFDQMLANGNPAISLPATNLNIGMDLWNMSSAGPGSIKMQPNPTRVSPAGREGMMPDQWIQDERELKRQKRKQSNRESARRSRLRKQAECEELQHRVEALSDENRLLADELQRLSDECAKLTSENESIKEELNRLHGPRAIPKPDCNGFTKHDHGRDDEGSSG